MTSAIGQYTLSTQPLNNGIDNAGCGRRIILGFNEIYMGSATSIALQPRNDIRHDRVTRNTHARLQHGS
jgi:hypothetical protein